LETRKGNLLIHLEKMVAHPDLNRGPADYESLSFLSLTALSCFIVLVYLIYINILPLCAIRFVVACFKLSYYLVD